MRLQTWAPAFAGVTLVFYHREHREHGEGPLRLFSVLSRALCGSNALASHPRPAGAGASIFPPMRPSDAIQNRRSVRRFTERPITRDEIEQLLDAATLAPNHRLTLPWRFYVLGPEARYAYGLALGDRKARKIEDPAKAQATREAVASEHRALPAMIAVATLSNENPEIREEDYAAVMMAVQNLAIAAVELGLGTHIKSGAVMEDPAARAAMGVREGERVVALVNVGEPAELPPAKARTPAPEHTTWLP